MPELIRDDDDGFREVMEVEMEAAAEEGAAAVRGGDDGSTPESLPELLFSDDMSSEWSDGGTPSPPLVRRPPRLLPLPIRPHLPSFNFHRAGPQGSCPSDYDGSAEWEDTDEDDGDDDVFFY